MEKQKPVLVVGATGLLGTEICKKLIASGKKVRALVRTSSDPEKINVLKELGVETMVGDLRNRSSLDRLLEGIDSVVSTATATISRAEGDSIETVDHQGQLNLVDAASQAFVDKFVFISFVESGHKFPLQAAKRAVEEKLIESNMSYTILRPTFFMEIWLGPQLGFDPANHKATIYGHGVNKVSWVSLVDVAAFAVASLSNGAAFNSIIDLGGPQALSPLEVIRLFEAQSGLPFELQYVPEEALRNQIELSPDPLQQSFASLMLALAGGMNVPMDEVLERFRIPLTSVLDYCRQVSGQQTVEA